MPRGHEAPAAAPQNSPEETFHFDQWEASIDSQESFDESREVSPMATRIENAASRVSDMLKNRSIKKDHAEAIKQDATFNTQRQNEAFATYDSNIATTADREQLESEWNFAQDEHRAGQENEAQLDNKAFDKEARAENRAEKIAAAKKTLRRFGRSTSNFAKESWVQVKSDAESIALGTMIGVDKVKSAAETASLYALEGADKVRSAAETASLYALEGADKARSAGESISDFASESATKIQNGANRLGAFGKSLKERIGSAADSAATRANERALAYSVNRAHGKANKINDARNDAIRYDEETQAEQENEAFDTRAIETAQQKEMGSAEDVYDQAYETNIGMQYEEATERNDEMNAEQAAEREAQQEAIMAAIQAAHNKRLRAQRRQDAKDFVRDTSSEAWTKSKGLTKKFGRSIAKFAKRTKAVAKATTSAARASWQETAA